MQIPEKNTPQRRLIEQDKEILLKSVICDEDFKFYENFNYFKRQFESIDHFKQIFEEDFFDYNLLKVALVRKHENITNYLINNCCCRVRNPNKINLEETPLHLSINLENYPLITTLLNKGASIYDKNLKGETPLHAAFNQKCYDALAILLDYISSCNLSFNPDNPDDVLHFHIACIRKHMNSVKLYLSLGFDINSHITVDPKKFSDLTPLLLLLGSERNYSSILELIQIYIASGADVNTCIPIGTENFKIIAGFTPLHFAVEKNCLKLVELLLKNGADWKRSEKHGKTPLHVACENIKNNVSMEMIDLLLNCSGSLAAVDTFGRTPIHSLFRNIFAPRYETTKILDTFISHQPLKDNLTDVEGISLFHIVCSRNRPDLVHEFLNSGVDINSRVSSGNFEGFTALHFAVYFNKKAIVDLLLKRNAPVHITTQPLQNTPLHLACAVTPFTLCDAHELNNDYRPRRVSANDDQPMSVQRLANLHSQLGIIKLLLLHGADINAKNIIEFTPLINISLFDPHIRPNVFNYISAREVHSRFTEIIKLLISNKADVSCTNSKQLSVFHVFCKVLTKVSDELMESCITAGANINTADLDGLTPLHYASFMGKEELVKSFLKCKAKVNVKCANLKIPLQYAISGFSTYSQKQSVINCITALLEKGSDVNVRTACGRPLAHDAMKFAGNFLIKMLLSYGADINAEDRSGNSIVCALLPNNIRIKIEVLSVVFIHVQKLLALGCHVNDKLQTFCISMLEYCKTEMTDTNYPRILGNTYNDCINELNKMKNQEIDNYTTLYNVLLKDVHELSKYARNQTYIDILEREDLDKEFPLYSYLLKLQYKRSLFRSNVLQFAEESLLHAISTHLPDLCCDSILKYLTNRDVVNLKTAVRMKESCSTKRKLNVSDLNETEETVKLQKED